MYVNLDIKWLYMWVFVKFEGFVGKNGNDKLGIKNLMF